MSFADVKAIVGSVIGDEAQAAARYPLDAFDPKAVIDADDVDFAVERLNAAAIHEDSGTVGDGRLHAVATGEDG